MSESAGLIHIESHRSSMNSSARHLHLHGEACEEFGAGLGLSILALKSRAVAQIPAFLLFRLEPSHGRKRCVQLFSANDTVFWKRSVDY